MIPQDTKQFLDYMQSSNIIDKLLNWLTQFSGQLFPILPEVQKLLPQVFPILLQLPTLGNAGQLEGLHSMQLL